MTKVVAATVNGWESLCEQHAKDRDEFVLTQFSGSAIFSPEDFCARHSYTVTETSYPMKGLLFVPRANY